MLIYLIHQYMWEMIMEYHGDNVLRGYVRFFDAHHIGAIQMTRHDATHGHGPSDNPFRHGMADDPDVHGATHRYKQPTS